ncbi:MAG: LCP family protein [Anaerolineae bacterium]|nr:LCP family protein [Anaerolineae bacterium]
MSKRQWAVLQVFAVGGFFLLWLLGLGALGLTFASSSLVSPTPPVAVGAASPTSPPIPTLSPTPIASPSPTLTPTATATLPPSPTPTHTHTPTPTSPPTPTNTPLPPVPTLPPPFPTFIPSRPTPEPVLPIPTAVPAVSLTDDTINIVVTGSDRRPEWTEWHTDAVHIVSIQVDHGTVTVLSIPRDLYLYIPGFWMSRINFADFYGEAYGYPGGGTGLLRDTILYNLGIEIDHVVRTDFDGLIGIVDTLGGVDIPVHCTLSDHWPYADENGEYPIFTLEPGIHHLDGEQALWYARSRLTSSTFSRERRQQQVLQAMWYRGQDLGMIPQIPTLWTQMQDMVVTDMGLDDVIAITQVAFLLQDQNIRFYNIGRDAVTPWTTPQGGSVFLPNWEAIEPVVAEAMAPIPEARMARVFTTVDVWNGTHNPDWDHLAADRLLRAGFPAAVNEPDRRDYYQTMLIVFSEYAKGTGVDYLQSMFNIPDERVIYAPDWGSAYGFRLIIGADYQTCYYGRW